MHLSFRVALAAFAVLTVSMAVGAHSKCLSTGDICKTSKDCCHGYECIQVFDLHFDEPYWHFRCENF
ncbi:hypothetical protein P692DRAFT_20827807 [Suillus brevipes Sb2]|nr:hypothetical protein P692DRAFT_20827807 [Suillus brevipes Sb2]